MSTRTDIDGAVKAALVAEARSQLRAEDLADDTPLNAPDFRLDSMGFLRAMVALEDDLGIRMSEELLTTTKFATVGDVVAYVRTSLFPTTSLAGARDAAGTPTSHEG